MKILYAIQGTGNGHLSRARDIIPALKKYCEVDILVSGHQSNVNLPYKINYRYRGLSFILGKKGGIDFWNTYVEAKLSNLRKEVKQVPVEKYDFVINDFEPVSAWACYKKKIPCISLSHQAAVLHPNAPKPKNQDLFGRYILKNYAPSNIQFGFHFDNYGQDIFTPVIRQEIRNATIEDGEHYTVYLPSYGDEKLISILEKIKNVNWHIFSKQSNKKQKIDNIEIIPIDNDKYIESLRKCKGLLCNAGFEGPAEALYLGKKVMVIPQKSQYEQNCNAVAIKTLGVPVIKKLKQKNIHKLLDWIDSQQEIKIYYPDITDQIVKTILEQRVQKLLKENNWTEHNLKYETANSSKNQVLKNFPSKV